MTAHRALADPAGLNDIRDSLSREMGRRWSTAAREVKRAIVANDALGLKTPSTLPAGDRAVMFTRLVDERLMRHVAGQDAQWLAAPLYSASARAARAQLTDGQQALGFMVPATRSAPICHAASTSSLASILMSTSRRVRDVVGQALLGSPRSLAVARIVDAAMGEGLRRSRMLAEHAVTQAYSQAVLDDLEDRGYTHVGTISERARRPPRKPVADALGSAAGVMYIDPAGRALFLHRTDGEGWAFPGGGVEDGESISNAAIREAHEECGGGPAGEMQPIWRSSAHGVDYTTFRQDIQQAFEPLLNHEHDDWGWYPLDAPPQPLHPGVEEMLEADELMDFDPDEPRDEIGRWTSGSGRGSVSPSGASGSAQFVSPSVASHLDFDQAKADVGGARHQAMVQISGEIDNALHLSGGETRSIIGAWSDGAENSIITTYPNASWDQVKLAAAMKGFVGDQKAVLAFKQDSGGDALLYRFSAQGDLKDIHQRLLGDGLAFHSLAPTEGGADVFVADLDGTAHEGIKKAAEDFGAHVTYERGKAEFIGAVGESATDRETRDDARAAYARTIEQSPVFGGADAWNRNRDRWVSGLDASTGVSAGGSAPGGPRGSEGLRSAQATAAKVAGGEAPLAGLPQKPIQFADGSSYVPGPVASIRAVAAKYMADAGMAYSPPTEYVKVDPARAKSLADAFDAMPNAPDDPAVKASYAAMTSETLAQWHALKDSGLKVEWIKPGQADPYAANPRLAAKDVAENNHWWGFPTDLGYGSGDTVDHSNNPMLKPTGEVIDGRATVVNDIFRVVHDYFGHFKEGVGFRAEGEDNAWRSHASMFSRAALPAMTAETRGQNSWVNFGPFGETNRHANAAETHYAPQKIGIMPDWAFDDIGKGRKVHDSIASWIADAARTTPQTRHPRTGRFAPVAVALREIHRSKRSGRFRRIGPDPDEQDRAERANRRFASAEGDLDVLTAGDDKVCPICDRISHGGPYTINRARSLIPAHPNCRCMFVPAGSMDLGDAGPDDEPRDERGRWTAGGAGGGKAAHGSGRSIEEIGRQAGLAAAATLHAAVKKAADPAAKRRAQQEAQQRAFGSQSGGDNLAPMVKEQTRLFHGTSEQAEKSILKDGLVPHGSAGSDYYARLHGMDVGNYEMQGGRAVSVYMTDDPDIARNFAEYGAEVTGSKPVLLAVDVPSGKLANLKTDEQYQQGIVGHAYRYEGKIPAEWIHKVPISSMKTPGLAAVLGMDAEDGGKTIYIVVFADGVDGVLDFDPDEPRDDKGRWSALSGSQGHPALISSRNITSVKEAPKAAGTYKRIDIAAMKEDPELFKTNTDLFKNGDFYPGMSTGELKGKKPDEVAEAVKGRMVDNLVALYKSVPASDAKKWAGWYEGANAIADENAGKYGVDLASSSGVLAALSPQNDWNRNVYQANVVMDALKNKQAMKWDKAMTDTAARIWKNPKLAPLLKDIEGGTLGSITDSNPDIANMKRAMWIRTENEAHSDRFYKEVQPDGSLGGYITKANGDKSSAGWNATPSIANAVASYLSGGDQKILSESMGDKHKVRSFFNNILDPHSKNEDVTIDTHAVGAAWLQPYTGTDVAVVHDLASSLQRSEQPKGYKGAANSKLTGVTGTYAVYADAYREAAHKLGIEPRQLQSVTWEAKQRLFSDKQTGPKVKAAVNAIWGRFHNGEMSLKKAQDEVFKTAREMRG